MNQLPGESALPVLVACNMNLSPMPKPLFTLLAGLLLGSGCSAIYPLRGVPAAYMPDEYKAQTREGKSTIDLSLLQRSQSAQYRIEAGDVLAVYAPGLLGLVDTQPDQPRGDNPPINLPANQVDLPSVGFPVTVRDDHTIQIPQLPAIDVYGLTEREVEDRLKQAAVQTEKMGPDPRIVVSIMRPRTYRVLVCRQEAATTPTSTLMAGTIDIGRAGKGTSRIVDLRAGENDVAHALAQPGVDGLPGLDARNVIYVIRARNARQRGSMSSRLESPPTPITRGRGRRSSSEEIVRGQSPARGFEDRDSSGSSHGSGPYGYMTATQFNLSGREIARGSTGPALIEPIPGRLTPDHDSANPGTPSRGPQNTEPGYGHSAPDGPAFHNPTHSTRGFAGPTGPQFAPAAHQPPAAQSPYMPVQYTNEQPQHYSGPLTNHWPTTPPVGIPPVIGSPDMSRYSVNPGPGMPSPIPSDPMTPTPLSPTPERPGHDVSDPYGAGHSIIGNQNPGWQQTLQNFDPTIESSHIIKIPVRLAPGEALDLTEEDITLYDGDIVFIENRDTDVYFIGGLLGGGQYSLPRDRDLHVLEAVSLAQGANSTRAGSQGLQSSGGVSALNRDVVPGASRLIILRQVGCDQVMTVEVDLYKALRYPHENILVQPSDMLVLQYTPVEATCAFLQRNLFEGALLGIAAGSFQSGGR